MLGVDFRAVVELDAKLPEFTVTLAGEGALPEALAFPHPFVTPTNTYLVVPLNEGIAYPVMDESIEETRLIAYGGHGICMAFWGATDGERGQMAILETPDDAAIRLTRQDGKLAIAPEWDSQKGQFGYERKLRYVFFDHGGHVAMCKRYRSYAWEQGLLKTLVEKRQSNSNIDLLIGAVNVWCWDADAPSLVREMKAAGVERILWSAAKNPDQIRALNDLGVLTSRYDIYQDVMDPAVFPLLKSRASRLADRGVAEGFDDRPGRRLDSRLGRGGHQPSNAPLRRGLRPAGAQVCGAARGG